MYVKFYHFRFTDLITFKIYYINIRPIKDVDTLVLTETTT